MTRAAVIRNPAATGGVGQFAAIQAAAPSFGVELTTIDVRDAGEIERGVTAFARGSNDGLIVPLDASAILHRDLIITLAARHRLPAVYPDRFFVTGGGLISYGPDQTGRSPTGYEMVLNLKTAKALGINVPRILLAQADEVIE